VNTRRRQHLLVLTAFCVVLVCDQASKAIVANTVDLSNHAGRAETFFYITHEENPGLVAGLFSGSPVIVKVAPILASLVLVYLYRYLEPHSTLQATAFGMIAGGAVGNLIDRFARGIVVDFLQFNFYFLPDWLGLPTKRYPAFNVADSSICVGVFVLLCSWHLIGKRQKANATDTV